MRAIEYTKYGSPDVLRLVNAEKPVPKEDEVLIEIKAAGLNAGDWHLLRGEPFMVRFIQGLFKPKHRILGVDFAGVVRSVGKKITQFSTGDEVLGELSTVGYGAFADFVCCKETLLVSKPKNIGFKEAAVVPTSAMTALQGLRDVGKIQPGQQVLINGASGGVGTFAVQIAKSFGAEVTGVCSSKNRELVISIGADHVIDYHKEDFTRSDKKYDLILDAAAFRPISEHNRALKEKGNYVLVGGSGGRFMQMMMLGPMISKKNGKRFTTFILSPKQSDLKLLKDLLEQNKIKPVIDKQYSLEETPSAIKYVEEGHARGKVVLAINEI